MTTWLIRCRYLVLLAWASVWAVPVYRANAWVPGDYYVLVYGGRALWGDMPFYHHPALHLYATTAILQVGPPILLLVGGLVKFTSHDQAALGSLIVACGIGSVWLVERTVIALGVERRRAMIGSFVTGLVVLAAWSSLEEFFHLEDAVAILLLAAAVHAIARERAWWIPALLLGSAAACKPWAVMLFPLILVLPRRDRIRAAGVAVGAAAVWWLPFVIADRHTISALSSLAEPMGTNSTLTAVGWSQPTGPPHLHVMMLIIGMGLATLAVLRGRWVAAPFAAFAARALLEPRSIPYYGAGPVVFAMLIDSTSESRVPWWTIATAVVEVLGARSSSRAAGLLLGAFAVVAVVRFALQDHADTPLVQGRVPDHNLEADVLACGRVSR